MQADQSQNCHQTLDISLSLMACRLKTPDDAQVQVSSYDAASYQVALYPIIQYNNIRILL